MGVIGHVLNPTTLPPADTGLGIHLIGPRVGAKDGVDVAGNRECLHSLPTRIHSVASALYWMNYPDHPQCDNHFYTFVIVNVVV